MTEAYTPSSRPVDSAHDARVPGRHEGCVLATGVTYSHPGLLAKIVATSTFSPAGGPPRLSRLYRQIRARVRPDTKVLVIGYPRLFPLRTHHKSFRCRNIILAGFQASEQDAANHLADVLDQVLGSAANTAGFGYVDSIPRAANHDPCAHDRYLNAFIIRHPDESFHPTEAGHTVWANPIAAAVI